MTSQDDSYPIPLEHTKPDPIILHRDRRKTDLTILELRHDVENLKQELRKLQDLVKETTEILDNIRSVLRVFSWIETFATRLLKIGMLIAGLYAGWKFLVKEFVEYLKH